MHLAQPAPLGNYKMNRIPYKGVDQTVLWMQRLAREGQTHPEIRRHAEETIRRVYPKDFLSEAAALYYEVCRRVRYTRDPAGAELVHHPALTHRNRAADCDDMAIYLKALLGARMASVGNNGQYVVVGFQRGLPRQNRFSHVFLRVQAPGGRWVVVDPVAGPHTRQMLRKVKASKVYPL